MDERGENPLEGGAASEPLGAAVAAVTLGRASRRGRVDEKTEEFLEKQGRLVDAQLDGIQAQHHLILSRLRWGRFSDWMKAGIQVLTFIIGLSIVLLVSSMAWRAHEAHGLVIDAFSVPPDVARTGLTGEVAASRFLDRLEAMQTATANSDRPTQSYESNWGSDVKVEIPETGLTFSEFEKLLRDTLGNVSHVTGEVTSGPNGLSLTARLGDVPPQTFTGPMGSFDALAQKSAEAVYGSNQPYRYAEYLNGEGRTDEALKVISNLAINGPVSEHGWAYAEWATIELDDLGNLPLARLYAARGLGYGGGSDLVDRIALVNTEVWSGHEEADLQISKILEREAQNRLPDTSDFFYKSNKLLGKAWLDFVRADYKTAGPEWEDIARQLPDADFTHYSPGMAATTYALGHDVPSAERALVQEPFADDALAWEIARGAFLALPRYWIAAELDRWPVALADAQAMDSTLQSGKAQRPLYGWMQQVWIRPLEALALTHSGDVATARAMVMATPLDCYLCIRVRGQIEAEQNNWGMSEHWFQMAVKEAPSLPSAYTEWAKERLERKDIDGAIAILSLPQIKTSPNGDAPELLGEALSMKGDWKGATKSFERANDLAPNWGRNHLKWAEALAREGDRDMAQREAHRAASLPLTPTERFELSAQRF